MFCVGNDELGQPIGDMVKCKACGKMHKVEYEEIINEDGIRTPSKLLTFISCPDTKADYLVGIDGREI